MANVFISHRGSDSKQAEQIADEIKNAGHNVWFDSWEINLGDSIIGKMSEGLSTCTYLILCYSKVGIDCPWMSREWMSVLARQLNGINIKIIPVVLSGGIPPTILQDLKYADLTKSWKNGISQILKALK